MPLQLLHTINDKDVFPNSMIKSVTEWKKRKTVKIIVLNDKGQIALVTNPIHGFFLLPGGGVERNEKLKVAAMRECEEEIGHSVNILSGIGKTKESRARDGKDYQTYCFLARISGSTGIDQRTENEKILNLTVKWFDFHLALEIFLKQKEQLTKGSVKFYNTGFNILRDKIFFEQFKSLRVL